MPPDLALLSTLIGSNYPCLELIFMVPKVFEPLKLDLCIGFTHKSFITSLRLPKGQELPRITGSIKLVSVLYICGAFDYMFNN